ncbi:NAD-dependent succinate-semialdehyde dehydrogenase [Arsukibacterium sp. UBA3155]|uniref:NAD-dependent succinate-semialdehyde dehydrogenase n=1 Tax=Arsukibacterium sp. UBA3155 TaxID=1946058 RepID=UPI0025C528EE|nr:NAD-dependent succinate-semialdehyde dehydrogenase [Arsukibacterium sp. UBA3155]|tara:strand:- start:67478 stop:68863 length:1386 start_codon:yes stop_codon:yes gene_type:complete
MADNTTTTINPFTEQPIKSYTLLSKEAAKQAIDKADKCFANWKLTPLAKRAELAEKLAQVIEDRQEHLTKLMTDEMGKVREQGVEEVKLCAEICRYTAKQAKSELADEEREFAQGRAIVTYQPLGVILGIQPWNFPLYQVIRYSITNVVAGNTTVLKHAANVFGMAEEIEAMYLAAGFPPHCYQSLLVDGSTASELISHPKVKGVTFTGSDEVGKSVAETAAKLAKKTVLELGSNDAYLVLDDADIQLAVETCVKGRIVNNGETCVAAKRFIITEKNYNAFKDAFSDAMTKLKMGDPNDDDTDLGPMARSDLRDKIHKQVTESVKAGATIVCGCKIPDRTGYFYPPSILENVSPGMPAYDDELFGPVAVLIKVKDDSQAITVANDSRYGLGGGIFSKDVEHAIELAKLHFNTGMININGYSLAVPNLPFGGVKDSGYGREHGGFGVREFVNVKSIMVTIPG